MTKNFQFYKQLDTMDCGATCLRMIARHYGRYYSLDYLRALTHQNTKGASLYGISYAAEQIGFHTIGAKVSYTRLIEDIPLPMIAHWNDNHFVVVIEANDKKVTIADPAKGIYTISVEKFIQGWLGNQHSIEAEGIVLLMEPTTEFYDRDDQVVDKGSLNYVWEKIWVHKKLFGQLIFGVLLSGLLLVIIPFIVQTIVDEAILSHNSDLLMLTLIAWMMLFASQMGLKVVRRATVQHIGSKTNVSMLTEFMMKVLKLPIAFFDTKMTDDIIQRLYDSSRVEKFLANDSLSVFYSAIVFILMGLLLLYFDSVIFAIFAIATCLQMLLTKLSLKKRRELDFKRYDQAAATYSKLTDLIRGMEEIKLNNAETKKRWDWERSEARAYRINKKYIEANEFPKLATEFIVESKNIFIIIFAAYAVSNGTMTPGVLLAIMFILGQLNEPIKQMIEFVLSYQDVKISLERMNEIHQMEDEENPTDKVDILPEMANLSGENVFFRYDATDDKYILKDLNFVIPNGKTTAIIGPSGSGKTTLLKLLLNSYAPEKGYVKLGEISMTNLQKKLWRNHVGVVMQDGHIFSDTIAKNIAIGDEVVDNRKLLQAAKVAHLQEFIDALPRGFNTRIGTGGVGLSKGQQQRILIARAVYKNPDYLFLDEATNDLDHEAEAVIMRNIKRFFRGKTVVILAHKTSPIVHAENIIMLEKGKVIEEGKTRDLSVRGGYYAKLLNGEWYLN